MTDKLGGEILDALFAVIESRRGGNPEESYTASLLAKGTGKISEKVAKDALDMLEVDPNGIDLMDRKLLLAIIKNFDGGPVGIESLSAALGEERGTIEDVIEPFLIQQGYLMRTSRGRVVTKNAYLHFGLKPNDNDLNKTKDLLE